jgi:hypothetical protein
MTARWKGHGHPELYNMINAGPGAGASDAQTQYWASLTEELAAVDADLNKALGSLKASWSGSASDVANSSMTPLQLWASDAQSGSSVMRASSDLQAEYVSTARAEMPEPVVVTTPAPSGWQVLGAGAAALTGNPGPAAMVALQAADNEAQERAQDAAAQKAVDTMQTYESNSEWNRNTLGTFEAPPDVVIDTPPPRGDGTGTGATVGGWNGNAGNFNSSNTTATGYITTPPAPGGGGGGTPAPVPGGGGQTPPPGGAPVGTLPRGTATGNNSGTDPSFGQPGPTPPPPPTPHPTPTPPTHGGPGPFPGGGGPYWNGGSDRTYQPNPNNPFLTGDSSGRGGSGGNPLGGRGPGAPGGVGGLGGLPGGVDADGRSAAQLGRGGGAMGVLPGGGAEGVVGRGGTPGGAGTGGRGGAGMAGGPMGAGGRGAGDEDDEHFSPDYLLETTDVFGDERMVSPAVIGENPNVEEK